MMDEKPTIEAPCFFDAHCVLGRHPHWRPPQPATVPELLDVMDRYGIGQALVTDCDSRALHPGAGNRQLAEDVRDEPRLVPAWVLLPSATGETPPPARLLDEMSSAGVKAAFLAPGTYGHGLEDWEIDDVLSVLAEARVPVFLDGEQGFPGWTYAYTLDSLDVDAAVRLAGRHPTLPVVMTAFRFRHTNRRIARAMQQVGNLHMELSGWWFYKNVESLAELVGPERLIFGTRLPVHDPAATKAVVQYADVSPEAVRLIAGENLRRLLSWDGEVPAVQPRPWQGRHESKLYSTAMAGADLRGEGFMDCHAHLGRSNIYHVPQWSPDELVSEMDRLGVEATCIFSLAGMGADDRRADDVVIEAQRRHPDRLIGFAFPGIYRPPDDFRAEIERCLEAGLRGIKTYTHDAALLGIACGIAERERLLILNHNWGTPEALLDLAKGHPNAVLIVGHTDRGYVKVFREVGNVYMCTCPLIAFGAPEWCVEAYGADRIMFGSDMSDLPLPWGMGPILYADVSDADKRAILGGNLRRLLETHSRPRGA